LAEKKRLKTLAAAPIMRVLAGGSDFTIVSNNCWGAHVYQTMGVGYATPFVGLFIPPTDYLVLLGDFDRLMAQPLTFVGHSAYAAINAWRASANLDYPIAHLGDQVEINFQHYATAQDAQDKWDRRRERMSPNPDRRFYKFDDREGATPEQIEAFCRLPLKNRLCFTAKAYAVPTILAPAEADDARVIDGLALALVSRKVFNTLRWISPAPGWAPIPALI